MDADFFRPFVESTLETLRVQCATEAIPGKPFVRSSVTSPESGIAAVIGVTGDGIRANVTLCLSERFFLTLMSNMLGEPCREITPELEDGAAELLNIIFGTARREINQRNAEQGKGPIQMAIPTILRGTGIHARPLTPGRVVVLPFMTANEEEFQIQISIQSEGGSP